MADPVTSLLPLASIFLAGAWSVVYLMTRLGLGNRRLLLLGVAGLWSILMVPVESLPLHAYIRGIIGDLSITSMVLLASSVYRRVAGGDVSARMSPERVFGAVFGLGILFYPLALGIGPFDPYRLGYGSPVLVLAFCLLAALFWLRGEGRVVFVIPLSIIAWRFGLLESPNLWDYLLDVWLFIAAALVMAGKGVAVLRRGAAAPAVTAGR